MAPLAASGLYRVAAAIVLAQFSLGGVYAWSTYVPGLTAQHGLDIFQTQAVFGTVFAVFVGTMLAVRWILARTGPRSLLLLAGLLYGIGHAIAWAGAGGFALLFFGVAVVSAIGTGLGYGTALAVMTAWLPQRPGLATAIAVTGFGGGSLVQAILAEVALEAGWTALAALGGIGVGAAVVVASAALLVRLPPAESPEPVMAGRKGDAVAGATAAHVLPLWLAIFCATGSGLLIIGMLKPLLLMCDAAPWVVAGGVSALAIGNLVGRIAWGAAFDAWRRTVPVMALGGLATVLFVLPLAVGGNGLVAAGLVLLLGACFGACFVVFAGLVSLRWGTAGITRVYPWVFTGYGLAGLIVPASAGLLMRQIANPTAICWYASALAATAAVLVHLWTGAWKPSTTSA